MLITYNQEQKITLEKEISLTEFTDTGHCCRS